MPRHIGKSGMFEADSVDLGILEVMIKRDEFGNDGKPKGLTSYAIRKGKDGISGGNWDDHHDKLLFYQLISKVYEKKRKPKRRKKIKLELQKSKQDIKFKIRYRVTPIGFCVWLKGVKPKDVNDKFTDNYFRFIPFIAKHWKKLDVLYGQALIIILKNSIDQIDLTPAMSVRPQKGDEFKSIFGQQLEEKVELNFPLEQIKISIFRNYHTQSLEVLKMGKKFGDITFFPNYDELNNTIEKRLTFIFYFNLLMLQRDSVFGAKIYSQLNKPVVEKSKYSSYEFPEDIPLSKWKDTLEKILSYSNQLSISSKQVTEILKSDQELLELFNDNLKEFQSKFKKIPSVEFVVNQIGKPG